MIIPQLLNMKVHTVNKNKGAQLVDVICLTVTERVTVTSFWYQIWVKTYDRLKQQPYSH